MWRTLVVVALVAAGCEGADPMTDGKTDSVMSTDAGSDTGAAPETAPPPLNCSAIKLGDITGNAFGTNPNDPCQAGIGVFKNGVDQRVGGAIVQIDDSIAAPAYSPPSHPCFGGCEVHLTESYEGGSCIVSASLIVCVK